MKNSAHFMANKRIIKKRTKGAKKEMAGFGVEILDIDFINNPWGEEITGKNYSKVFNDDTHTWEVAPQPQYTVKISKNGYSEEFIFTDSINAFVTKKTSELESILTCILDDAQSFLHIEALDDWQGAENVMNEFGYEDIKKARDIYHALHETYLKIKPMVTEEELYTVLNETLEEWR